MTGWVDRLGRVRARLFSSLGTKLALANLTVLVIVSALLYLELAGRERQGLVAAKLKAAHMAVDVFAASLSAPVDFADSAGVETAVGFWASNAEVEYAAAWVGEQALPMAELRGPGFVPGALVPRPLEVPYTRVDADHIEIGAAVTGPRGNLIGRAVVRFSLASENAAYRMNRLRLLGYSFGIASVTALLLIAIARRQIIVPLDRLVDASRRLEHGAETRVEVRSSDEVGRLGVAFNNMAAAIRDRQQRLDAALASIAKELEEAKQEVRVKERLEKEMEIARSIQTALLPRELRVEGLELAARMIPATEVGGDYYDILPRGDGCWLAIGDVSGHGVTAGLIMLMAQSVISALTKQSPDASPRWVLCQLNRVIYDNIRNRLDKDDFMTLSLMRYERGGRLQFCGAHEDIVVCHPEGACERLLTRGTWVGLVADVETATRETSYQLRPGDVMVLYTDGVTEAMTASGEQFGLDRLCAEVERVRSEPVEAICGHLLGAVRSWMAVQNDDITLVVTRYTGSASVRDRASARDGG